MLCSPFSAPFPAQRGFGQRGQKGVCVWEGREKDAPFCSRRSGGADRWRPWEKCLWSFLAFFSFTAVLCASAVKMGYERRPNLLVNGFFWSSLLSSSREGCGVCASWTFQQTLRLVKWISPQWHWPRPPWPQRSQ
jgi:hypothetical protein